MTSQRASTRGGFSTMEMPADAAAINSRTRSHMTNHSDRYQSPLVKQRALNLTHNHDLSVDSVADIARKLTDLKSQTNRPMHLDGTLSVNERFSKRMFIWKNNNQNEKDVFNSNIKMIGQRAEVKNNEIELAHKHEMQYLGDIKRQEMIERLGKLQNKQNFKRDYTDFNVVTAKHK